MRTGSQGGLCCGPLPASVGQSPVARTKGQNKPLWQLAGSAAGGPPFCAGGACSGMVATAGTATGLAAVSFASIGTADVLPLPFSAAVGQSPASRMNGQNVPLLQVAAGGGLATATGCMTGAGGAGGGPETGIAVRSLAAIGAVDVLPLPFSAAAAQSPDSRMNGQKIPLEQLAATGGLAAATGCMTAAGCAGGRTETGIAAGSLAAAGPTGVLPLLFSAAVGQSPDARMNGQNVPFVQLAAVDGPATAAACTGGAGGGGGATEAGIAAGSLAAAGTAGVLPLLLSAAVGQSPAARMNGQNVPFVQLATVDGLTAATGCAGGGAVAAETGIAAGVLAAVGTVDVFPLPASAAVGQSPSSRTNGHNMPL